MQMNKKLLNVNGFVLVELLITITIIGILAAMVLPRMFGPTEQGRSTEARNMLGTIRQLEEAARNGPTGGYFDISNGGPACEGPVTWEELGMTSPNGVNNYFSYCVDTVDNTVTPPTFRIRAIRTNINASPSDTGSDICLNQNGVWSGAYSQVPQNPSGCACGAAGCPGPCCP